MGRFLLGLIVVVCLVTPALVAAKPKPPAKVAAAPAATAAQQKEPLKDVIIPAHGTVSFTKSLAEKGIETAKFAAFNGAHWNLCGKYQGADVKFEIRPEKMTQVEFLDEIKYGPESGSVRVTARATGNTFLVRDAVICHTDGAWDSTLVLLFRDPLGEGYHPAEVKLFDHYIKSIVFE